MRSTLLIAATLAAGLAAGLGTAAPAMADHDGCYGYNCGRDNDFSSNPQDRRWNQNNWGDHRWSDRDSRYRLIPKDEVADELRRHRFRHLDFAGLDRGLYRYDAVDARGNRVRVAVDGHTGRIVNVWQR